MGEAGVGSVCGKWLEGGAERLNQVLWGQRAVGIATVEKHHQFVDSARALIAIPPSQCTEDGGDDLVVRRQRVAGKEFEPNYSRVYVVGIQ